MRTNRLLATAILAFLLSGVSCEDEHLLRPGSVHPVDPMFERYVAIGNSITAGFQSLGINDSLQSVAYPVLVAQAMGSPFLVPYMNRPGCPSPIDTIRTQHRLGGLPATFCALRRAQAFPPPFLSNIAIPGAELLEAFNYSDPSIVRSATDVYRTFLLGGYTQVQAARRARPTFVSIWLGNNDAIGAILDTINPGAAATMTPPATFSTRLAALLDSLADIGTIQGGIMIGAVQVARAPYVSTGRAYAAAAAAIPTLIVLPNCLVSAPIPGGTPPNDSAFVLIPFHYGAPRVAAASAGVPTTLDCSVNQVISATEAVGMITTVAQYNAAIQTAATGRGWAYIDPNTLLATLAADPNAIRPFPAFTNPNAVVSPFGTALSRDGIHPSTSTQRLIAQAVVAAINARYSTTIPAVP